MKKHFLKSFALIAMLFSALTLSAASGVDWSSCAFLGDGAGGGKYTDKYKVSAAEGLSVINIQQPPWSEEAGIYVTVPAGISECTVNGKIDGIIDVYYLNFSLDNIVLNSKKNETFKMQQKQGRRPRLSLKKLIKEKNLKPIKRISLID